MSIIKAIWSKKIKSVMVENQRVGYIICHCIIAGLQNLWLLLLKEYVYVYSEFYYTLMSTAPVLTYLQ